MRKLKISGWILCFHLQIVVGVMDNGLRGEVDNTGEDRTQLSDSSIRVHTKTYAVTLMDGPILGTRSNVGISINPTNGITGNPSVLLVAMLQEPTIKGSMINGHK
ncbi:hypothetical protein COOONC_27615 [Cooperia oncophora]